MIARRKADRIKQVHRWLIDNFHTPYPTKLFLVKPRSKSDRNLAGWVVMTDRRLRIYINVLCPKYVCLDTLMHEMAHCCTWPLRSMQGHVADHSPEWGIKYAEIYSRYADEGGSKSSGSY